MNTNISSYDDAFLNYEKEKEKNYKELLEELLEIENNKNIRIDDILGGIENLHHSLNYHLINDDFGFDVIKLTYNEDIANSLNELYYKLEEIIKDIKKVY